MKREFDAAAAAQEVVTLLEARRMAEALPVLEQHRQGQPEVLQDALDRLVVADARTHLMQVGVQERDAMTPTSQASLTRLQSASGQPRFPVEVATPDNRYADGLTNLTDAQEFNVYASIVKVRGNDAARAALENPGERVILGLRRESSTLSAVDDLRTPAREGFGLGTGEYDDRVIVLWKDRAGNGHVHVVENANTEPSAQYDHHSGSDGTRRFRSGAVEARREASAGFEGVKLRKIEGEDVNNDGVNDLGRLAEGTIEMQRATHPSGRGAPPHAAFRPTPQAVIAGGLGVQRDTNGDGWFTATDINGIQELNNSFKFHRGGPYNTDSAGCQTIPPRHYDAFIQAAHGNPTQTRWQYVLTSATPGMFREVQVEIEVPDRQQQPARREGAGNRPPLTDAGSTPTNTDHPLHRDALGAVQRLNASLNINDERATACMAGSLACLAKQNGFDRIDHALLSIQSEQTRAGEKVFIVQGDPADPAKRRAHMQTQDAIAVPPEESLKRLTALEQASPQQTQTQQLEQSQQQEAPRKVLA